LHNGRRDVDAGYLIVEIAGVLQAVQRHHAHQYGQFEGVPFDRLVAAQEIFSDVRLEYRLAEREIRARFDLLPQHADFLVGVVRAHVERAANGEPGRLTKRVPRRIDARVHAVLDELDERRGHDIVVIHRVGIVAD